MTKGKFYRHRLTRDVVQVLDHAYGYTSFAKVGGFNPEFKSDINFEQEFDETTDPNEVPAVQPVPVAADKPRVVPADSPQDAKTGVVPVAKKKTL
jgi:hypothetical protein